jgi:hypothetical protein
VLRGERGEVDGHGRRGQQQRQDPAHGQVVQEPPENDVTKLYFLNMCRRFLYLSIQHTNNAFQVIFTQQHYYRYMFTPLRDSNSDLLFQRRMRCRCVTSPGPNVIK